jgi:hypothetical protein
MDMERGSNVRSPSLIGNTNYIMKTWNTKEPTFKEVKFLGFTSGTNEFKSPTKQLKDMLSTDFYRFMDIGTDVAFRGKMVDNCLVDEASEIRVTFFDLAGVVSEKPVKVTTSKKKTTTVAAPPPPVVTETPEEAKRRVANERKRAKRLADKLAKEAGAAKTGDTEHDVATDTEVLTETETVTKIEEVVEVEAHTEVEEVEAEGAETEADARDDGFGSMPELEASSSTAA